MFSIEDINEMQKTIERKDRIIKVLKERVRQWVKEYNILDEIIEMYKMSENEANEIIAELKAENKRLKELKCKFKEYCTCNTEKYVKCLQEIKAIAEQILNKNEFVYMNYRDVRQIIRLITKAEEE